VQKIFDLRFPETRRLAADDRSEFNIYDAC
jgi:hypothetical protein